MYHFRHSSPFALQQSSNKRAPLISCPNAIRNSWWCFTHMDYENLKHWSVHT